MASAFSIRHFILGLLTREPMSGYDIKRFLKGLGWLIDSPSFGSLYPTLHALLRDALVTVEVIPQQDKPPRKIYSITNAGRKTLRKWTDRSGVSGTSLKAFLMRLILAGNLSHDDLIAHLERRRTQVAAHLEQTVGAAEREADMGERLALEYGLAMANAELVWLDSTLTQLSHRS